MPVTARIPNAKSRASFSLALSLLVVGYFLILADAVLLTQLSIRI